jgi:threonine/homoserine/homoserine lactone efflux protein
MNKMKQFLSQDNGVLSMIRLAVVFVMLVFLYFLWLFTLMVFHELSRDEINYSGLALIFGAMFVEFILVIILKVMQKKYEHKGSED